MIRYFSLFSGIGGFELGINQAYDLQNIFHAEEQQYETENTVGQKGRVDSDRKERLGHPICVGYSEIDRFASSVYKKHFPNHINYGDITKINERELPDFDLLVGGFPCQSFSIAGKRGGFEDTRGTLFFDIARLLKEKQPRLCLFENVKGLLSHDEGRTFRTIISTLDELGYDLQWQVLNSKDFGVPQNRERVFIAGHLRGTPRPEIFPITGTGESFDKERVVSTTVDANYFKGIDNHGARTAIIQVNKPIHSNDRVYDDTGLSPTLNAMQGGNRQPFIRIPEATKKGYAEATVGQSINLSVPNSKTRRGRVSNIAQTLDTGMQQHTLMEDMRIRKLTPKECERLQGFPDDWTVGISDTQRYKCCGNAVTTNVVAEVVRRMLKNHL